MDKKYLVGLIAGLLLSSPAFATRARLHALNQDGGGSYYITDTRNLFLNPAQVGLLKENATFEWGRRDRPGLEGRAPEAEGGFVSNLGRGKLGVELGRVNQFSQLVRTVNSRVPDAVATTAGTLFAEGQNNVDVIYGFGTEKREWGLGLELTRSRSTNGLLNKQANQQGVAARFGVYTPRYEAFGGLLLGAKSSQGLADGQAEMRSNFGVNLGGGLQLDTAKRVYAALNYNTLDITGGSADYAGHTLSMLVGWMNTREIVAGSRFFYAIELMWDDVLAKSNKDDVSTEKFDALSLPLTLGVEADALAWLRLRASVRQGLLLGSVHDTRGLGSNDNRRYDNAPNDTMVAAGAGTSVAKFNFDVALLQSMVGDNAKIEGSLSYLF